MADQYKQTVRVGILRACMRYIEDPNRSMISRIFLALAPLFIVWVVSPLDIFPEAFLGPLGLTDDALILISLILLIRLANNFYRTKRYVKNRISTTSNNNG